MLLSRAPAPMRIPCSRSSASHSAARRPSSLRVVAKQSSGVSAEDLPPAGCSRIPVTLSKPLGIVLEQNKAGDIFVVDVVPTGAAAKSGLVEVGDQLIATSAVVYNTLEDYGGVTVRKGQERVRLLVKGEKFDTVMAAIGSHPGSWDVTLELQKCKPLTAAQEQLLAKNNVQR